MTMREDKASKWQDKHLRKMENLIYNAEFQNDLKHVSLESDNKSLYDLAKKYEVQPVLLLEYIKNRTILARDVSPSISIICDEDETAGPANSLEEAQFNYIAMRKFPHSGVQLHIPPGSSQIEITSFIKDNWSYIKTKIGEPDRNKRQSVAERNARIMDLHQRGLTNKEILEHIRDLYPGNLIVDDIGSIIRKNK